MDKKKSRVDLYVDAVKNLLELAKFDCPQGRWAKKVLIESGELEKEDIPTAEEYFAGLAKEI